MDYPLISEYREAILSAEDNFSQLTSLRPVLDSHGDPVMSSGNFAVVFKMKDVNDGKLYAVKCFIKDQEGRHESYSKIADELEQISSSYILPLRYLENELFVDSAHCDNEEFPVVVMEWVEGETLDAFLKRNLTNKYELEMLSYRVNRMVSWLLAQPFAHGDLKPDNILVRKDGSLVLVDYDGMFVPSMTSEKAREIGSPDYRHPLRTDSDFNEHIDDFSIVAIALSLKAIALNPDLKVKGDSSDALLLSEKDYRNPGESEMLKDIQRLMDDSELALLFGAFSIALAKNSLDLVSFRLFMIQKPAKPKIPKIEYLSTAVTKKDLEDGVSDEFNVIYSEDGKRLLKCDSSLKLKEYFIKSGTQVICKEAFLSCRSLQNVTIPDSVTSIGDGAFEDCETLQSVAIPKSVTSISEETFYNCWSLQSVTIPDSITSIGNRAFSECSSLQSVMLPNSIKSMGKEAFYNCWSLQSVTIPDSVTSIGNRAFSHCSSLQSVTIPDSVTSIGESVFWHCRLLQSVTIPKSVTSIGNKAFSECSSLQSVTIPDSVTSIGESVFSHCSSLKSVTLPDSVTSIGTNPFSGCGGVRINLSGDSAFRIIYGMLIDPAGTLISCLNKDAYITIPDSVTRIGERAFEYCETLKDVTIPEFVTSIGEYAFLECPSLWSVTIPDSVTSIGEYAFSHCSSLKSVTIPDSVTTIGERAFQWCESLQTVSLPDTLNNIGKDAFPANCQIIRRPTID